MAPDLTAAIIAGGGGREATVSPGIPVVTVTNHDRNGGPPMATIGHGMLFVIQSDSTVGGRYEAELDLLGPANDIQTLRPKPWRRFVLS